MSGNFVLSRRQCLGTLAASALFRASAAEAPFRAIEINHIALRVKSLAASEEFYRNTFGAPGIIFERPNQRYLRVGTNFVALFERGEAAMDHYAISIEDYDAAAVEQQLQSMGLKPRRSGTFVYVHDPDGVELQIAHAEHEVHSPVMREKPESSIFRGAGVNHVALRVTNLERSREFYQRLFGLPVRSQSASSCFLGINDNFLAMFAGNTGGMDHFCISIQNYRPDEAMQTLRSKNMQPRRESDRIYFPDPNGLTVQISAIGHQ